MKCVELNFFGMYGIQSQVDKKAQTFLLICKQVVTNMLMNCYVWYGVVRCGVVWCGVVWCGARVVWCTCGVVHVWCGVVWCGVGWGGVGWGGVVGWGVV